MVTQSIDKDRQVQYFHSRRGKRKSIDQSEARVKKLIWLYFILLIFEGALRKWVLTGLATPLLIVRDPVALIILALGTKHKIISLNNGYLWFSTVVTVLSFCTSLWVGHGNLTVALFGIRIMLIHFPLIFVVGRVLTVHDVSEIGRVLLWISLPMTVLVAAQFYSPQSAWVNRGVGGDMAGAGFSGAMGYFRPPGTFSFINGLTSFYGLVAAYLFYYWLSPFEKLNRWFLIVATGSLVAVVPMSISRTLLGEVALSAFFALAILFQKPKIISQLLVAIVGIVLLLLVLNTYTFFQTGVEAFTTRFESANQTEGGAKGVLVDRFLGGMYGAIVESEHLPLWGHGIGMGTNAGAKLMTGKRSFLISEEEWGRLLGEMGIILGMLIILIRLTLAKKLAIRAFIALKTGYFLPWMLLSFSLLNLIQGQWAQPTALGFAVLSTGLTMAALKTKVRDGNVYKS